MQTDIITDYFIPGIWNQIDRGGLHPLSSPGIGGAVERWDDGKVLPVCSPTNTAARSSTAPTASTCRAATPICSAGCENLFLLSICIIFTIQLIRIVDEKDCGTFMRVVGDDGIAGV